MRVRTYDADFVCDALGLVDRGDRSLPQVAAGLGIPHQTLRYWYNNRDMPKRKRGRPRKVDSAVVKAETAAEKLDRLEREVRALRRENEELKTDREILKKAAAFFVKESE